MSKPILCLDFDGVIHSYTSGWHGADVIPDPPVPGALEFIVKAMDYFTVAIYSSRSNQRGGIETMKTWLYHYYFCDLGDPLFAQQIVNTINWPTEKPAAFITIDDRALTFNGDWSSPEYQLAALQAFKPWNKRVPA